MNRFFINTLFQTGWLLLISHLLPAQTLLQGRVTDAATGKPLSFATVYINTTTRGTTANADGQYKLTGVPAGTVEVVASYLGYKQARSVVKLRPAVATTVNLMLLPTGNSLDGVTVTAKRSKAWERLFRRFKSELLGDSPFTGRCVLMNEQAVILTETEDNHLIAKATEPLVFENTGLGYRIHYDLLSFDHFNRATYYAGATRFEELTPDSPQQQKRWQRNRQVAYIGSTRHMIASMVAKTQEQEGYLIYKSNIDLTGRAAPMAPVLVFEGDRPPTAQMDSIFRPGELPAERTMVLDGPLEIFYTRVNARNSPYRDMPYAYSLLVLPNKTALVTTDGWVSSPNGMEIRGYLSKDRLANLLPADWRPDATASAPQTLAEGFILPPDARLDSLKRDWKLYQKTALPTVYLHTDKAFYTTGDNLWFSAYVLNPTTFALLPNRFADLDEALHLDWIGPSGQTLLHQWVPVKNGRAEGTFQLPDSLQTGVYALRAYTEAGRTERRPAFEKSILVSNGLSSELSDTKQGKVNKPTAETKLIVIGPKQPEAAELSLEATTDTTGIFVRIRATGPDRENPVYLAIQSRDRFVGQAKIKLLNGRAQVMIPAFNIPSGLTRLTLFDAQGHPKAEEMVSVSSLPGELVRVDITAEKPHYSPREQATIQIRVQDDTGDPALAFLSASVTDADQLPPDSLAASLRTHLLAGAAPQHRGPTKMARRDTSAGIVVRGVVVNTKARPVPNANVLLSFVGTVDTFARSAQADEQGRFHIDGLALTDTAQITMQIMGENFKPIQATVKLDLPNGPLGSETVWPVDTSAASNWKAYLKAIQLARLRQAEDADRYRNTGAQQLKEVVVKAARNDDSEARRVSLHGSPDGSVVFKQEDANRYANVFEMLQGKLPGVQVQFNPKTGTYNVVVRGVGSFGGNNAPLFLRDGQYVDQELLMATNPAEIERIEVVKNSGATIYGARGGAGVIAFFTRKWTPDQLNPGGKKLAITGYPLPRQFTFPAFNTALGNHSDRRDVLLWQPQLKTDAQGQATLTFPLTDVVRTLRVTVQGITATGQPVSVERLVKVQ